MGSPSRRRVNDRTRSNAIRLRQTATVPEQKLWDALKARQISNLKFRRQHPIDTYIVDFFCAKARLIVEVDGQSHDGRQAYDKQRQNRIESLGFYVLRITNDEVLYNLDGVLETIVKLAVGRCSTPSPNPSPCRGGGNV